MELVNIKNALDETGLPVAYHHFNKKTTAPFIIYFIPDVDLIGADDTVYKTKQSIRIELYTLSKDIETEATLENILIENGLFYSKSETYISEENMYEIIYESEDFK